MHARDKNQRGVHGDLEGSRRNSEQLGKASPRRRRFQYLVAIALLIATVHFVLAMVPRQWFIIAASLLFFLGLIAAVWVLLPRAYKPCFVACTAGILLTIPIVGRTQIRNAILVEKLQQLGVEVRYEDFPVINENEFVYLGLNLPSAILPFFVRPSKVRFPDPPPPIAELEKLDGNLICKVFYSGGSHFGDAHMKEVVRIIDAPFVELESAAVTPTALGYLSEMSSIKRVFARMTMITIEDQVAEHSYDLVLDYSL